MSDPEFDEMMKWPPFRKAVQKTIEKIAWCAERRAMVGRRHRCVVCKDSHFAPGFGKSIVEEIFRARAIGA